MLLRKRDSTRETKKKQSISEGDMPRNSPFASNKVVGRRKRRQQKDKGIKSSQPNVNIWESRRWFLSNFPCCSHGGFRVLTFLPCIEWHIRITVYYGRGEHDRRRPYTLPSWSNTYSGGERRSERELEKKRGAQGRRRRIYNFPECWDETGRKYYPRPFTFLAQMDR